MLHVAHTGKKFFHLHGEYTLWDHGLGFWKATIQNNITCQHLRLGVSSYQIWRHFSALSGTGIKMIAFVNLVERQALTVSAISWFQYHAV